MQNLHPTESQTTNQPLYVDSRSNHPPSILKQIPISINKRISSLSSDQESFDECKPFYESALKHSNYNVSLEYSTNSPSSPPSTKRRRQRNIIWFNPTFSKSVKTNIARNFLQLLDKHFPPIQVVCTKYSTATQLKLATAACLCKERYISPQQSHLVKTHNYSAKLR